jgi:PKD repeat protein
MRKLLLWAALVAAVAMNLWAVPPPAQTTPHRIVLTQGETVPGALGAVTESAKMPEAGAWALSISTKPSVLFSSADAEVPVVVTNPKSSVKTGKLRVDFLDSSNNSKMSSSPLTLPFNPGNTALTMVVPGWMTAQAGHLGLTKIQVVLIRSGDVKASDASPIDYDLAASIHADFTSGSAPLHVSFTAVVSGGNSPYTFDWDYGDTAPHGSGPTSSHTYLYSGNYTATVHVTDHSGGTAVATLPITVSSTPFSATCNAAPTSGQLPLAVAFSATPVGGSGTYTYDWNFGDGSPHSTLQNPNHTYTAVGNYTATVTVGSQGQTVTCSSSVSVYSPLAVTCSVDPHNGPAPLTANFSATPSGGTGTYTYDWDFGDGGAHSPLQNPTHNYLTGGTYTATVRVTSGYQQASCTQVVNVAYPPVVITASAVPVSGPAPLNVSFTASAAGGNGGYSYSWDFGDGGVSNSQSPSHTYATVGLYTARLTVLSTTGQSATWTQLISVNSTGFSVAVTASPTTGPAPLSTTFTTLPTGGTAPYTYLWNFGDGSTGSVQSPTHTYTVPGSYAPNVTVTDGAGKQAFWSGAVSVDFPPLVLNAGVTPLAGSAPLTVSCTSSPTGGNGTYAYHWDFGDGSAPSTAQNPAHTYTTTGIFTIQLTVTSGAQSASWSQLVTSNSEGMSVLVTVSPSVGSAPLIVNFVSTVSGAYNPVTYLWEFGDGNTSTDPNPTHIYQNPGAYAPKLTVTDAFNRQAFWNGSVTVNFPALTVQADAHPSQGPPPLNVTFTAQGYGGNGFYTYHWDFGDGSVPSPNQNTTHTYGLVGLYTAVLTVTSGTQTVTWSHAILVNSAGFSVEVTAAPNYHTAPMTSTFTANILGGTAPYTYSWIFGDPGSGANDFSTLASPSHTYNNPGTYTALLNVVDSDGRQAFGACAVVVLYPSLTVTGTATPSHGPAPLTVAFSSTPSGGNPPYTYSWNFGDGSPADPSQNPTHTYTHTGVYAANVTVTDELSQTANWAVSILVDSEGFTVTVQATPSIGYYPLSVNFVATPSGGTPPYTYAWNFGDPASGPLNTSTLPSPTHVYNAAGTYTVILILTDVNGMQCTWMGSVAVHTPDLYVTCSAVPNEVGIGTLVAFSAQGHGGDGTYVYTWDFGDGSPPVVAQATTHAYASAGVFTASVAVTSAGQTDYCYKSILVHDPNLTVVATANPRLLIPNQTTAFTATPSGGNGIYTYWWDFGDGFTSTLQNPNHAFTAVGIYTVNLTVTSAFQRAYWATTIYVNNPQLCITASGLPTQGTRPLTVLFNSTVCNPSGDPPYTYFWDTGDGSPNSTLSSFNHTYTAAGLYNWYVKLTDSALPTPHVAYSYGSVLVNDPALVVTCTASPNETSVGSPVLFTASSAGGNGVSYTYVWNFGDGNSAAGATVSHAYLTPGNYTASVTVTSGTQVSTCYCVVLVHAPTLNISVAMTPLPGWINPAQPGILAAGSSVLFIPTVTGGDVAKPYTYAWDFGDGTTSAASNPPPHLYANPGLYTVNVVVTNGYQQANWTSTILVNSPQLTVALNATPTSGVRPLTVTATPTAAGGTPPYTYTYIWGDGMPNGAGAPPQTHAYTTAGTYTLVARVDDSAAHTAFSYQAISVTDPLLSVTCSASPKIVAVGGSVNFTSTATGGTGSYTYTWNFGDGAGTAATQNATYAYTTSGVYTATVTVTSGTQTQTCYCVILVNDSSMGLSMTMTPAPGWANGQVGRIFTTNSVAFNAAATGGTGVYTYYWDFGDGGTATGNPVGPHAYAAPGIYTVNLKVTSGTASYYWAQTIAVSDPALSVSVAMTPNPGWLNGQTGILDSGNAVSFNATATGGTGSYTYAWTFGDGGTSAVNPTGNHTYANEGLYNVTLTVTSGGQTAVWFGTILVNDPQLQITSFTGTPTSGNAPLAVTFGATGTGGDGAFNYVIANYGDGASDATLLHTYAAKGIYTAVLRVWDNSGHTAYSYVAIQVDDPLLTLNCVAPAPVKSGLTYTFSNPVVSGGNGTYAYSWDFGDGTGSTLAQPAHTYPNTYAAFSGPASYTPIVTVTSGDQTVTCTLNTITTAAADYPLSVEVIGVTPTPVSRATCPTATPVTFSVRYWGGTTPYTGEFDGATDGSWTAIAGLAGPDTASVNLSDICGYGVGNKIFTVRITDSAATTAYATQVWSIVP